jgi:uncharacterized repeat protein (TIGR01451 family)
VNPSQGSFSVNTNGQIICTLGTIAPQAKATVTIVARTSKSGVITDTASVGGNYNDYNSANSTIVISSTVSQAADLAVLLTASPSPASIGSPLIYTVTVTNRGPDNAGGVSLTNTLPSGLSNVSASSSQGSCSIAGNLVVCTLGTITRSNKATVTISGTPSFVGFVTNSVRVVATQPADLSPANNSAALITQVNNPSIIITAAGATLVAESFVPHSGGIEPGETVTVNLALRNVGISNTVSLVGSLRNNNGGVTAGSAPANYGALVPGGVAVARAFTFTASGVSGGSVTATLDLADGALGLGTATFTFPLGGTNRFFSSGGITIADNGHANPYPSQISVSGMTGTISKVTVTLSNLAHAYPDDIDALLVNPAGQAVLFMSDAGGNVSITNVNLTFDDAAGSFLPDGSVISSGTFKPSNFYGLDGDVFASPAPAGPYGTNLFAFNGSDPNGLWSLYIMDDSFGDLGSLGGWSLNITTAGRIAVTPGQLRLVSMQNGHFQFTVDGVQGDSIVVEATTDLSNPNSWTPIATNVLVNGSYNFIDVNPSIPQRFYRAFER